MIRPRRMGPYVQRQGWGRIINIGGLGARHAVGAVTGMRNVAVVALTKNLALGLGPNGIEGDQVRR